MDTDYITNCISNIHDIHHTFSRALSAGSMDDWTNSKFGNFDAIDIGNRYYTNRNHAFGKQSIPFKQSVDPNGILQTAMGSDFLHTEDNEVEYYELVEKEDGLHR